HEDHAFACGAMLAFPAREPARPAPGQRTWIGLLPWLAVPVGALPPADLLEVGASGCQAVMEWRLAYVARGGEGQRGVVALIHESQRLHRALPAVLGVGLIRVQPVDVETGHVDVRMPGNDPVRQHPAEASPREDADRVQAGRNEIAPQLRRLAHD